MANDSEVKAFTISRAKWFRAEDNGCATVDQMESALLLMDGRQCCLGHYLSACGVPKKSLRGNAVPSHIWQELPMWARWVVNYEHQIATLNDEPTTDAAVREERITSEFAKHGIAVSFVD